MGIFVHMFYAICKLTFPLSPLNIYIYIYIYIYTCPLSPLYIYIYICFLFILFIPSQLSFILLWAFFVRSRPAAYEKCPQKCEKLVSKRVQSVFIEFYTIFEHFIVWS